MTAAKLRLAMASMGKRETNVGALCEELGITPPTPSCSARFQAEYSAIGGLLKDGMPIERALSSTLTVAKFVRRGQAAQQAVDAILSAGRSKRKS